MRLTHKMIAHAVSNENGDATGGAYGDQKGFELCACPWYAYPSGWVAVYRANDATKADGIAKFMEKAVSNGHLGYDQTRSVRKAFFDAVVDKEFAVEHINENHGCDCSSLVYAAVRSQYNVDPTGVEYDNNTPPQYLYGIPLARMFNDYLMTDIGGFTLHNSDEYLNSNSMLERGDILLADGHIAVWI